MANSGIRDEDALAIAAADLKRHAPTLWAEFEKVFRACGDKAIMGCVNAPPDQLVLSQGKARAYHELSALFGDAIKIADAVKAKAKQQR